MYSYHWKSYSGRQSVILACADSAKAATLTRSLQCRGWKVYAALSGPEARRLLRMCRAVAVVLDTDLPDESGWLTCAKIVSEFPQIPVVLLTDEITAENKNFARFVGATAIAPRSSDVTQVIEEKHEPLVYCR